MNSAWRKPGPVTQTIIVALMYKSNTCRDTHSQYWGRVTHNQCMVLQDRRFHHLVFTVKNTCLLFITNRFAQFFLCPLFTSSATEREVNAVDSENDKNLQNDSWRLFQLEKATCDSKHDFSKFGTGMGIKSICDYYFCSIFQNVIIYL